MICFTDIWVGLISLAQFAIGSRKNIYLSLIACSIRSYLLFESVKTSPDRRLKLYKRLQLCLSVLNVRKFNEAEEISENNRPFQQTNNSLISFFNKTIFSRRNSIQQIILCCLVLRGAIVFHIFFNSSKNRMGYIFQ